MDLQKFDPNDSLAILLSKTTRALSAKLEAVFTNAGHDVTSEQWIILLLLWGEDGRFPYQIAQLIGKDRAAVTRLIDGLEKRNLVVRIVDKNNRRQRQVYLTPQGREMEKKLVPLGVLNIKAVEAGLTAEEIETCKTILRKLYNNIIG